MDFAEAKAKLIKEFYRPMTEAELTKALANLQPFETEANNPLPINRYPLSQDAFRHFFEESINARFPHA